MAIETLTYRELAMRLGVSLPAAKMRVTRNGWTRMKGNDGKTRVQVPTTEIDAASPPREPATAAKPSAVAADASREHIADLRKDLEATRAALATAEAERTRLLDDARQERGQAHQEREKLLATIDTLTAGIESATRAQADAERHTLAGQAERQAESANMRRDLEAIRKRGLWARIMNR